MAPRTPKGRSVADLAAVDAAPARHRHGRIERLLFEVLRGEVIDDPAEAAATLVAIIVEGIRET